MALRSFIYFPVISEDFCCLENSKKLEAKLPSHPFWTVVPLLVPIFPKTNQASDGAALATADVPENQTPVGVKRMTPPPMESARMMLISITFAA